MTRLPLALSLAALAAASIALPVSARDAKPRPAGVDASIPFAGTNIRNFQPDGDHAIYIQDQRGKWFHATLLGYCPDLPFATAVGFDTGGGTGTLDSFSSIIVGRQHCQIDKLVTSDAPPAKAKKKADK